MAKGGSPKKQGPTPEERALNEVSIAQWNDYVARFQPAEAELAKLADLTPGEIARVTGEASADAASAFTGLNQNTVASNLASGADVASGRTKFALAGNETARGKASGLAQSAARTGAELDRDAQKTNIARLGRNIAGSTTADLSRGARRATALALNEADARFKENQARTSAFFAVAGAATRKFGPMVKNSLRKENFDEIRDFGQNDVTELDSAFFEGHNPFSGLFNT